MEIRAARCDLWQARDFKGQTEAETSCLCSVYDACEVIRSITGQWTPPFWPSLFPLFNRENGLATGRQDAPACQPSFSLERLAKPICLDGRTKRTINRLKRFLQSYGGGIDRGLIHVRDAVPLADDK